MDFDAVESRLHRVDRALAELLDDAGDLVRLESPGRRGRLEALQGEGVDVPANRRRGHGGLAVRLEAGMGDTADVPELQGDPTAAIVDGLGDLPPPLDFFGSEDPGREGRAGSLDRDLGRLGQDQSGAGALRVVLDHGGRRHALEPGAGPRHGRHHDPVSELDRAELDGLEEGVARGRHEASPLGRDFGSGGSVVTDRGTGCAACPRPGRTWPAPPECVWALDRLG